MAEKKSLPLGLRRCVDDISNALADVAEGRDGFPQLYEAVQSAVSAATSLATAATGDERSAANFGVIIGKNLKDLRTQAGWSQERLATAMADLGFGWKRITVAETELALRRVTLEEVLGLGVLFAVPATWFLIPVDGEDDLEWPQGQLDRSTVTELLFGRGGKLGVGGLNWSAPARASGGRRRQRNWRPASDLYRYDPLTGEKYPTKKHNS